MPDELEVVKVVKVVNVELEDPACVVLHFSDGRFAFVHVERLRSLRFYGFSPSTGDDLRAPAIDYVTKHRTELLVKRRLLLGGECDQFG